jgi:hypothetical protein
MAGLLTALASLAAPILARVLLALGFSVVTYVGMSAAIGLLRSQFMNALSGAPLAMLQLAGLAGVWSGLGMLMGGVTFIIAWWGLTKAVRVTKGS